MTNQILLAGFGGQGILFSGKFLAYDGLLEEREVSWLPSYGPEMRGGTCNCSVILSDTKIGSPIVANPDILIAMNLPRLTDLKARRFPAQRFLLTALLSTARLPAAMLKPITYPQRELPPMRGFPVLRI